MDTTNKPVAWIDEINTFVLDKDYQQFPKSLQHGMIPLYTHPVKEQDTDCQYCKQGCIRCDARKQLTDEEIMSEWEISKDEVEFARAILRKAQEQ
jgi:hypothetical protein